MSVDVNDGRVSPIVYNTRLADEKGEIADDVLRRPVALAFGLGGLWVVDQGDVEYRDGDAFYKPGTGRLLLLKAPPPREVEVEEPPATRPA